MEDDGVRLVEQQPIGGRLAVGHATAGRFERLGTQAEIETGAAVVLGPEQDDLCLAVDICGPLQTYIDNK